MFLHGLIVLLCLPCVVSLLDGNLPAVSELIEAVQHLNKSVDLSRIEIHNLKTKVDNLTTENLKFQKDVEKYSRDLIDLNATLHTRTVVAFTARRSQNYDHLGDHQTIEFDTVIANLGNAYDSRHGHFIAPVKGVYHFLVTMFGWSGESTIYALVKNGDVLCDSYSVKAIDGTQGTCAVTIALEVNDMVWVRFEQGTGGNRLYGSQHNSFTGFLITRL